MAVHYRVDFADHTGRTVGQFADFLSMRLELIWNGKSSLEVTLSGFDERLDLIAGDYLARVWFRDLDEGIDWSNIFTGFHKTEVFTVAETGQRTLVSYAPSLEELVDKAYIMYPAGSAQVAKSGAVSTVMGSYVRENVMDLATVANGRDDSHVVPGFTLAPDTGAGPQWSGSRTRRHLLTVLQELADYSRQQGTPVDFRVNYAGDYTFQFEAGALAADRTTAGLVQATGQNAAGNVPVILSLANGNITRQTRSYARYNEGNVVFALGEGEKDARNVAISRNEASIAVSPVARREFVTSDVLAGENLQAVADAKLQQVAAERDFNFKPRRGSQILFRDYFPGDFVTGQDLDGTRYDRQIVKVIISVSATEGGQDIEDVDMEFAES